MKFDNKQFESGVKTSMDSIGKLKESLNFTGASKGLENISAAAKNVNMSGLSGAVETVHARFSALEVMAVTALVNITNMAMNAGKRFVNAFAIEPITTGFQEFELKMGSVQTIMTSTGASLDEVNKYLEELNTYSDKTIYSFSDMTNSIGKFTNAGVKLDDAVMAIKGISNEAAVSGANANEASRAMYNFAQALSSGSVKLIDWKSIENANMATVEFKEQLLETAVAVGTVEKVSDGMYKVLTKNNQGSTMDEAISSTKNFNDSLAYQWMTTDVLIKTLRNYADETTDIGKKAYASAQDVKTFSMIMDTLREAAQSGWAQTWEIIVGDFEEGKALWTELSSFFGDFIEKSADARNSLLSGALDSKWDQFVEKINEAGISTDAFSEKLKAVATEHDIDLDGLIEKYGSLGAVIAKGKISGDMIIETIDRFTESASVASGEWTNLSETIAEVVRGDFGNGQERIEALTKAGYDNAIVQDLVNKTFAEMGNQWGTYDEVCEAASKVISEQAENFENMSDAQLESMGYTKDQIKAFRELAEEAKKTGTPLNELIMNLSKPSGRELLISSVMNILKAFVKTISTVKEAWSDIFPPVTSERLYSIIERFHDFTQSLLLNKKETEQLKTAFKGLFGILDVISSIATGTLTRGFDFLSGLWKKSGIDILGMASSAGEVALAFRDWFYENELLSKSLDALFGGLGKGVDILGSWFNKFLELPIVQESIAKFEEEFNKFLEDPKKYFDESAEVLKGLIDEFKNISIIQQIISGVKQSLGDFGNYFKTNFPEVFEWFDKITSKFQSINTLTLSDVINTLTEFKNSVKEFLDNIGTFFGSFKEGVEKPFNEAEEEISSFRDRVFGIIESIQSKMPKINWGAVLSIGAGVGILALITKMVKAISVLTEPIKLISTAKEAIENVGEGIQGVLRGYADSAKANALIKIALAIAILAGSITLLTVLDTGKMAAAVVALGVLAGGLIGLSKVFGKIGGLDKASFSMIGISASIIILVSAFKMMESLNFDSIGTNLVLLAALAGTLVTVATLLNKFAPDFSARAISLVAIAVSIKILVGALIDLGSSDLSFTNDTIAALIVVIAGLAAVSVAARGLKMGPAVTLLAIPIALKMFISALDDIADFDISKISDNIDKFIEIFGMFAALMLASKLAGSNAAKAGIMFVGIAASLLIISNAIDTISDIDPSGLNRATGAISQLLVIFALLTAVSSLAGANAAKAGVMLLAMSGACLILTGVIAILSDIDGAGLSQALGAITVLSLIFAGLIAVSKLAGDATKTILALTVAVGVLAVALGVLSLLEPDKLLTATAALTVVMLSFTALFGVLGLVSKFTSVTTSSIAALGAVMVVVALLAGVLYALSALNVQSSIENVVSLSALLLAVSGACLILSAVGKTGASAVIGAASLVGAITVIGGFMIAVGALTDLFPEAEAFIDKGIPLLEKIGYGIGSVISNFAAGLLTGGLPEVGKSLSEFMMNMMPFFAIANTINSSMTDGIASLAKSILMITGAELVDSIASFFIGDSSLGVFGTELAAFGEALVSFSESSKGIDADAITTAAAASESLATLLNSVPNSGGALADLVGDNTWGTFKAGLPEFGKALSEFSTNVSGIDADAITTAASASESLASLLNSVPNSGGALADLVGDNTWSTFKAGLPEFGKALSEFSGNVKGITSSDITEAASAAGSLATLLNSVPNSGGALADLVGDQSWDTFRAGLPEFGKALSEFSTNVEGISSSDITEAADAAGSLAELQGSFEKIGGIMEFFTGKTQTFEQFGADLEAFGGSLTRYSESIESIKPKKIKKITDIIDEISAVQNAMKGEGDNYSGVYLSSFGGALEIFGDNLSNYYQDISSINSGDLSSITDQISSLVDIVSDMSGLDTSGVDSFSAAIDTIMSSLAGSFSESADGISSQMVSAAETMMSGFIDGALDYIKNEADSFESAGQTLTEKLTSGAKSEGSNFSAAYTYITGLAIIALVNAYGKFYSEGQTLTEKLTGGAKSNSGSLSSAITYITGLAVMAARNAHSSFYAAGSYLVDGFTNGISDNSFKAAAKARAMAKSAAEAAKSELDENSPSKVFYKIGDFAGLGFVNALYDYSRKSFKAGREIGDSARKGLGSTIAMISDTVMDEINTEPVIKPVLDLSDVKSRAGTMNGMLTLSPAIGINENIRAISSSMNNRQNGTNNDIIAAIEKMAANTNPVSGDTYVINGITYDDGSNIVGAVKDLIRAARVERRA